MPDSLAKKLEDRIGLDFGGTITGDTTKFYKAIAEETLAYVAANAIFIFSIGGVTPGTGVTVVGTINISFPPQV